MERGSTPCLGNFQLICVISYVLVLALFSVRPWVPVLRDELWGSELGAWSMYRSHVEAMEGAVLVAPGAEPVPIDISPYFWHARFANSAHGEPQPSVVAQFAKFLLGRPELCAAVSGRTAVDWTLIVFVAYRSGAGPARTVESRFPACRHT